ncbi:MAG: hypothetical protein ABFS08_07585 [Pseudomonadota bacterium]
MKTLQQAGALLSGYHRKGGARFVFLSSLLFALLSPLPVTAVELADITRLAKGGASQLALSLLTEHQPDYEGSARQWQRWERVRVRIMRKHGHWPALAEHIAAYPHELPDEFRRWSEQHHATALINAGQYAAARHLLRGLIWQPVVPGPHLAALRRLVMQSYLEEGRIRDAYAAMLRYHQDYGEQDSEALLLRAKVLLASGRAGESLAQLRKMPSDGVVEALRALATLRSGEGAASILKQARVASVEEEDTQQRWIWLGVMAEAAQQLSDHANLIIALERMLPLEASVQVPGSEHRLFSLTSEQLWQAYLAYADRVGNREQLLVGDDAAWLAAAEGTDARYPVRKRSLYAAVSQHGVDETMRERAHQALLSSFDAMGDKGVALLRKLYLQSKRYSEKSILPQSIAYRLVDEAIKNAELTLASRLLQQLPQPPGGTALFAWQMRRAKVFQLAGDYAEADRLLTSLMPGAAALTDPQRDQLVQLLFDLQAVNEHERAFRLLAAMYQSVPAIALRRELLFWMADSRKAQLKHTEAARFYLQSATLSDNNSMDPWAQTARYQAAKSLSEAGMVEDATFIYRQLLRATENPERRSVLRHELHQLRLAGERG